jgi:DNA-binding response OmpR family regulator
VLLIDDNPTIRDMLPRALAHAGLHFETAASGGEGLELATALLPDLIILDVLLPDLDGWSVLSRLKAAPETRAIPVLMQSISAESERGIVLGAVSFLHAPVSAELIAAEVATLLRNRQPEPPHLLLVEGDPQVREALRISLTQSGWAVVAAADGSDAIAQIDRQAPAIVVIDLGLTDIDAIALISQIRARAGGETLPILAIARDLTHGEQAQLCRSVEHVLHNGHSCGDELVRSTWALVQWQGEVALSQREN